MIEIQVPGLKTYEISQVVVDYNGTIAVDGKIPMELKQKLTKLSKLVPITVLTADTHGTAKEQCEPLGLTVRTFPQAEAAACKQKIVEELGPDNVACLGNGFNDIPMFKTARLSIAVMDVEGMCGALLPHATILCRSSVEAIDLLMNTKRIIADLRT